MITPQGKHSKEGLETMKTRKIECYQYAELDDAAKEKARDWYRSASEGDSFWSESALEDAATIGEILGIDFEDRNGKPAIYFSGFSSQGDGACFEGYWSYKPGMLKAIAADYPNDGELHRIAKELSSIARRTFYTASARITHSGHYYHSGCMSVDVQNDKGQDVEEALKQAMRDFADWIYNSLEMEWNYQNSDDAVAEAIEANEYEFTKEGEQI